MRRHQRMVADDWRTFVRPPSGCQNISFSKFVSMKRESLIPFMSNLNLYVKDSIIERLKYLFGPWRTYRSRLNDPFQLRTIYTKFNVRFFICLNFLYESLEVRSDCRSFGHSKRM